MFQKGPHPSAKLKDLKRINIDHHKTNTNYGNLNFIESNSRSTTQILFSLFKAWKVKITPQIANVLLLGLITDTGCFRYPGVTADDLAEGAELVKLGADLGKINYLAFNVIPPVVLKVWQVMINNMEFDYQRKIVWTWIDYQTIQKLGGKDSLYYEEISNTFLGKIADFDLGIFAQEKEPGFISIGFRSSTGKIDAALLAEKLGGGGHKLAAGFKLKSSTIKEAKQIVLNAIDNNLPDKG